MTEAYTPDTRPMQQVRLAQGDQHVVAWNEARGAKLGAQVEVRDLGGFWDVTDVYDFAMPKAVLSERQRMQRNCFGSIQ